LDHVGRQLGDREFPTTPAGYRALGAWLNRHGQLERVGVEGTGTYGAGLVRYLRGTGVRVVEVDRPDRTARRAKGKSDSLDAYAAARAALSGTATSRPTQNARRAGRGDPGATGRPQRRRQNPHPSHQPAQSLADHRPRPATRAAAPLEHDCADHDLRQVAANWRLREPEHATKTVRRRLARRHQHLTEEITEADIALKALVTATAPHMLALIGVGAEVAGQLLVTAGDNPDRLRSEAAFAHLCGPAPLPVSSGRTHRHRLNRGGDRAANNALYIVVLGRLRYDSRTRADRRTQQDLSKREIIRCLKRYVAREIYAALQPAQP